MTTATNQPKRKIQSKTLWVNFILLAAAFVNEHSAELNIDPETAVSVIAVVNILLRYVTHKPIK